MFNTGKCPKCEKAISSLKIEQVPASTGVGGTEWKAISFCCKSCGVVLSVQIDPVAIKADILNALGK